MTHPRGINSRHRSGIHRERGVPGSISLAILLYALAVSHGYSEENLVHWVGGASLQGIATYDNGTWTIGDTRMAPSELLAVRFTKTPPPKRVQSAVFFNDGSVLTGTLESVRKGKVTVKSISMGRTLADLTRECLAGAFYPLPDGQQEKHPFLKQYALLRARVIPSGLTPGPRDAGLPQPGHNNRITLHNLDVVNGSLLWLRSRKALVDIPGQVPVSLDRAAIRLIECRSAPHTPAAPPTKGEHGMGGEVAVRLKAGDVLRGRLLKLDERELKLATRFCGTVQLPRATLAMLFPAGEKDAGLTWLTSLKPARNEHIPYFDARFPARAHLSCDGGMLTINGHICDLGLGVHSKSVLDYTLDGAPGRRFLAWVGIDDETRGRGAALARVLLDDKECWNSGVLKPNTPPKRISIPLGQAKKLTLLVDFGPDNDDAADHIDWGWAAIVGR